MAKFKILHSFIKNCPTKAEEVIDNGDGTKTIKNVTKDIPYEFCLKRPSRADFEEAELFYNSCMGKAHENGLISHAVLAKRLEDAGGLVSESEKKNTAKLKKEIFDTYLDIQKLEVDKPENFEERKQELTKKVLELEESLTQYGRNYGDLETSVMQVTAESWSRNQLVSWWMLLLLHRKDNDWIRIFPEETHNDRKDHLFEFQEEEDEVLKKFNEQIIFRATLAVAYWLRFGTVSDVEISKLEAS